MIKYCENNSPFQQMYEAIDVKLDLLAKNIVLANA
jgi:hypothetical protein